jgi:hypothetical protein
MDSPNLSVSYAQLGNLASVKERELHEINETRVRTLEAALASKSASLGMLKISFFFLNTRWFFYNNFFNQSKQQ